MRSILICVALAVAIIGCQTENDLERPTVEINLPIAGDVVTTNDGIRLVATLTDNTGLLQYKLTLNGIDSLNGIAADSTISMIFIEGILDENKAYYIDQIIPLPDSTFNGYYQATLECIDIEGNLSLRDTVNFMISNSIDSDPPEFNVVGPTYGDTLMPGEGFGISGNTTDSQSLIYSRIYVGTVDGSFSLIDFEFANIIDNTVDYNSIGWYLQVDTTWTEGAYHMYITSWDNYSGVDYEVPFYVFH